MLKLHRSPDGIRLENGRPIPRNPVGPWQKAEKRLAVGCGALRIDGWVHLDRAALVEPDVVHDLESPPMPFSDDHFDYVWADNVIEHLAPGPDGLFPAIADVWRVLTPGGYFEVTSPTCPHPEAFAVDHRCHFTIQSFERIILAVRKDDDLAYHEWYGFEWEFEIVERKGWAKGVVRVHDEQSGIDYVGYRRHTWIMRAVK